MAIEKIIREAKPESSTPNREVSLDKNLQLKSRFELPWFKAERSGLEQGVEKKNPTQSSSVVPLSVPAWHSQRATAIDTILSEGLNEIFLNMKPVEQKAFIKKGEETVTKINELLSKTKVKMSRIIALIKDWLKMIPGVNKFFLEQEAKIKADKILKLKNKI